MCDLACHHFEFLCHSYGFLNFHFFLFMTYPYKYGLVCHNFDFGCHYYDLLSHNLYHNTNHCIITLLFSGLFMDASEEPLFWRVFLRVLQLWTLTDEHFHLSWRSYCWKAASHVTFSGVLLKHIPWEEMLVSNCCSLVTISQTSAVKRFQLLRGRPVFHTAVISSSLANENTHVLQREVGLTIEHFPRLKALKAVCRV